MAKKDINEILSDVIETIKNQINYYCDVTVNPTETKQNKDTINEFINKMENKTAILIKKGEQSVAFVYKSDEQRCIAMFNKSIYGRNITNEPIAILTNLIQKFIADYSVKELKVYEFSKKWIDI